MVDVSRSGAPDRPTLDTVARAAGVSKATASKVLNKRPDVAPATRRRVEEAMTELDYAPRAEPRPVARRPLVTVVCDTPSSPHSALVLDGVVAAGRELGIGVLVEAVEDGDRPGAPLSPRWIRAVGRSGRLGVVVVGQALGREQVRACRDSGVDVVVIDPPDRPFDRHLFSLGTTNYAGAVQATEHLLRLGHRRIAHLGGPAHSLPARERANGYRSAVEAGGLPPDPRLVLHGDLTYSSGVAIATRLLQMPRPPTAIFAACDAGALGVIEAARRLRVRVPDDLSVVGFGDEGPAAVGAPPLTTVRQPLPEMGRSALKILVARSHGEPLDSRHVQLATRLVRRESTAPPTGPG